MPRRVMCTFVVLPIQASTATGKEARHAVASGYPLASHCSVALDEFVDESMVGTRPFRSAFENSGFTSSVNWYRNLDRNWHLLADVGPIIHQPTLMIYGARDTIPKSATLTDFVPNAEVSVEYGDAYTFVGQSCNARLTDSGCISGDDGDPPIDFEVHYALAFSKARVGRSTMCAPPSTTSVAPVM